MACKGDKHDDPHKTSVTNGRDWFKRPWHREFWKCYACGATWEWVWGPGA